MKKYAPFFVAIANVSFFYCFSQPNNQNVISNNQQLVVVSYHVEERVNMNFGSSITTYDVPSLDMINSYQLVGDNVRIITPKYATIISKTEKVDKAIENNQETVVSLEPIVQNKIITDEILKEEQKSDHVNIDVVGTYERVMDKGYRSIDMLTKVADRHFFEGNLILAVKWYSELFENNTDLEAVYYYRYAQSLLGVGETDKSKEMMKLFETKSL